MTEDERFHRKSEDQFKEASVKFHNGFAVKKIEQLKEQMNQESDQE